MRSTTARKQTADWTRTPEGDAKYRKARAEAQRRADASGCDIGIERNDLLKEFRVFRLPRRENRYGHELRCEVVSCEDLERCQPGHGLAPRRRPRAWTKREVRTLTGILDSFFVCNRPLSYAPGRDEEFRAWLAGALAEHRGEILVSGVRGHLTTATERSAEYARTAQHYLANPDLCSWKPRDMVDGRPEIVVRFERFAAEEAKAAAWLDRLLARLGLEALPPEVAAYDPLEAARVRR